MAAAHRPDQRGESLRRGLTLGDPTSALGFREPWRQGPHIDLAPLDPTLADDRCRLHSYIWPDEPERLQRLDAVVDDRRARPAPDRAQSGQPVATGVHPPRRRADVTA
jgi:uncharacterized protein DUF2332